MIGPTIGSMHGRCERLHAYVDGELDAHARVAFESHLATCDACGTELPRLLALLDALERAAGGAPRAPTRTPHLMVVAADASADSSAAEARPAEPHRTAARAHARMRRRSWMTGLAGAVALAAGLVIVVLLHPGLRDHPGAPVLRSLHSELGPTRGLEARLSYPGTEAYRPLDVQRGTGVHATASHVTRLAADLEQAGNWHGLAVASLLAGRRETAAQAFARAPSTPQVDSDRAAFEILDGSPAALERALEHVDRALAAEPDHAAARWNRALVLAALNLPLAAARELDRIGALGEPGWAGEARTRAALLRAAVVQRRTRWRQAYDAGLRLIEDGAAVPIELAEVTGTMTMRLYDAVRAAPSRERALALLPLAQALDAAYHRDRLASYVLRIAASDFRIRKPLADSYRALALGRPMASAADADAFLSRLANAGADDLRLGTMIYTSRVAAHLEDYRRLAAAAADPWFTAIAEHETAKVEIARGQIAAAEHRLAEAIAFAQRERLAYRALLLEDELIKLHSGLLLSQAAAEAAAEYREATSAGEWILEMRALTDLAAINQNRYANGLARAYLTELAERADSGLATGGSQAYDCARREYAYGSLANISVMLLDPGRAREEISRAPACEVQQMSEAQVVQILRNALVRSELYRFGHREDDARLARDSLAALRTASAASGPDAHDAHDAHDAMIAYIEGNLAIENDRALGQRSLREAIAKAGARTDELSVKARAYGFSLLALDAGRASEWGAVIATLAQTLEVPKPERCAVAIAVDAGRAVVAFSDARGQSDGRYVAARTSAELDVATLVPAGVVDRLRACERVVVLARAPVLGAGRLLPPDLAWSYRLKTSARPDSPPVASQGRRVVIANPLTPPELNLPPLGPLPDEPNRPGVVVLRGPEATPTRVQLAMRDASIIEFHTHGLFANDVLEPSYLVLSPELDRQYAMTAAEIAHVAFSAAPLVILGACHAATSSRSLEGGMGLAEAFLRSGARAVIASPDAIPDLGAHTFFAAVRERILHGADPAVAVRDERIRRRAASHDDAWVTGVVVFE